MPAGVYRDVSGSCVPGGAAAGGSSILMVCSMPGALSLGWSFAMLSAAHREMHSRLQLQEHVRSQLLFISGRVASAAEIETRLA